MEDLLVVLQPHNFQGEMLLGLLSNQQKQLKQNKLVKLANMVETLQQGKIVSSPLLEVTDQVSHNISKLLKKQIEKITDLAIKMTDKVSQYGNALLELKKILNLYKNKK